VAALAPALDVPRATVVALASRALLTLGDLLAAGAVALPAARPAALPAPEPVSPPRADGTAR
jgi:hypothetical protein